MNSKSLTILLVIILLFSQNLSAQDADQSHREKRDRLWTAAQEAEKKSKYAEAAKLGEQMLLLLSLIHI